MSLGNTKQVSSIPRLYPLFEHVSFCVCQLGTVVAMECIAKGPPTTEFSICFQCNDTGRVILKFHVNFNTTSVIRSYQREDCRYIFEDIKKNLFLLIFYIFTTGILLSKISYSADDEESDGEFPFQRGKLFKIAFGIGDKAFIIAVNGQYFTYYNYPVRCFSISTLKCLTNQVGDFQVRAIEYHSDSPLLSRVEKLSLM